jgi:UDP-N-acetylmuramoylalanine--D-glutamate ligase
LDFKLKKVLVVGLGKTGKALVAFLGQQGAEVLISDTRPEFELKEILREFGKIRPPIVLEGGGHSVSFFSRADLVLVSPGIPLDLPPLLEVQKQGTPVWGELELFASLCRTPVVAVTGTNGKTTTTALLNEMLLASGKDTFLGGNIGPPLMEYILSGQTKDMVVAEISSFQLDASRHFVPQLGLLLNITEDHLDRYPSFQTYADSKAGLFRNKGPKEMAVLNWDDPLVRSLGTRLREPVYYFSRKDRPFPGAFLDNNRIFLETDHHRESYGLDDFSLPGVHNLENALAAVLGARLMGATSQGIQKALSRFKGFGHRLEWVAEIKGVNFYDDSKGTNVGAVVKALEGFYQPVFLIAGGRDKHGDYGPLKPLVQKKVRGLALIGEARQVMSEQLGPLTKTVLVQTLEDAVHWTFQQARPGDAVLLSPACSSFDMFRDYAHRGKVFQETVKTLARETRNREQGNT